MNSTGPKPKRKKRKPPTAEQLQRREQRAHEKAFEKLFVKLGFTYIATNGIEFTYGGRTGELDGLFVHENIVLLVEYTIGKPTNHLSKKKLLWDKITPDGPKFLEFAKSIFPKLSSALDPLYQSVFDVRIIYASKQEPSDEIINACPNIHFMHGAIAKYFQALANTIEKSARVEFLKFLTFSFENVGASALNSSQNRLSYSGFRLPAGSSHFPTNYQVVSFYADPERLMARSYVLRRDGWRDETHLYQRILVSKKIRQMRRYLLEEKRVFVNNIIVTLPPETRVENIDSKRIDPAKVQEVTVHIPDGFDTIGLVDGQHRVFCYHEGTDNAEDEIKILRKRQNLMVTGIVYPVGTTDIERRRFEAKLFLEINDNQTRARSSLKHDIEVIIRPSSGIAVAKRVIQELGRRGPYKGMLQTSYFDDPTKIKTSSIVSYGLRPLVKLDGEDSLFSAWNNPNKAKLKDTKNIDLDLLEDYIKFCTNKLSEFLLEAKLSFGTSNWDINANTRSPLLSPTAINGLIVCLRKIIGSKQSLSVNSHKKKLKNLNRANFPSYKSSQWQKLGLKLFEDHYG